MSGGERERERERESERARDRDIETDRNKDRETRKERRLGGSGHRKINAKGLNVRIDFPTWQVKIAIRTRHKNASG